MVKRALMIGINEYSDPKIPNLRGCRNDVEAMASILIDRHGFEPANLTKLVTREETTREQILAALKNLIEETQRGDVAVVHYSGHGSQAPDRTNDERNDRKDETIVPSDSGRSEQRPVLDIVDDELDTYVGALSQRTPFTTFIFDSCHSGSITREVLELDAVRAARRESRIVPRAAPPADEPPAVDPQPYPGFDKPLERPRSAAGLIPPGDYLLIAGCLDAETSGERNFEGVAHGLLTYYLLEGLRSDANSAVEDVFQRAKAKVEADAKRDRESQQPVLEGPAKLRRAHPFSPVSAVRADDPEEEGGEGEDSDDPPRDPPEPGEWDGKFAALGAVAAIAVLALLGIVFGVLTCSSLDGESSSAKVVTTLVLELVFVGLLLGMAGAYIALLNLRGRSRAVSNAIAATGSGERGLPAIGGDEIKGVVDSIGKMPTARALIVVGGLVIAGAVAFAWDVLPGELGGKVPEIDKQPTARKAALGGKAQFAVSASGSDLEFKWKRNGAVIPWAGNSPTLVIDPVKKADKNDLFTVVVRNDSGVAASDGAKLTIVKRKGKGG
jgi:Caspase domain